MTSSLLLEDSLNPVKDKPHLSYSRINRYLTCPEQYRLYYLENLRPRYPSANLVFGKAIHQALAYFFQTKGDPVKEFQRLWLDLKETQLTYSYHESWETLQEKGKRLLELFVTEELPQIGKIESSEKIFEISISGLDLPITGVIDLIADVDGKKSIVDFKTSGSSLEDHEAAMSDQLTAYSMAEPQIRQCALCVLVKTKEPRIEWQFSSRRPEQMLEYLEKVSYVSSQIQQGPFYKRVGKWCSYCEFLPVCSGNESMAKETLKMID